MLKSKLIVAGLITLIISIFIVFASLSQIITSKFMYSLFYSALIGIGNFILFTAFAHFSVKKSNKTFLIVNFGGMVIRLILMLVAVLLMLNYLKVDQYAFIFGLLFWYIFFLFFEILIVKESYKK